MSQGLHAALMEGGAWTHAAPAAPQHLLPRSRRRSKSILPGAPNRVDVPAPTASPWRGIGLLNFFQNGNLVLVGTGFLCQADVLVTARHNLTRARYDAAGVWMAFDGARNPADNPISIRAYAMHRELDLAVFILGAQLAGSFELGGPLPPSHAGVALAGYAMPYADGSPRFSYALGPITASDDLRLAYAISTREGDSGAPLFTDVGGVPHAIGVHAEGATDPRLGNRGVRLSPPVVSDVLAMIAWARGQVGE